MEKKETPMDMNYFPFLLFALIMTVTPGPNNLMLALSGSRFGFRRTLPLLLGIVAGILSQICLSALGLGLIFERYPAAQKILKIAGSAYILFLAVKTAFPGGGHGPEEGEERTPRFLEGALFQYLNPKAYIMTLTAVSVYALPGERFLPSSLVILATFALVAPLSISLWAGFGAVLGQYGKGRHSRLINLLLGAGTASTALFILL